jgi:hypothetical protein
MRTFLNALAGGILLLGVAAAPSLPAAQAVMPQWDDYPHAQLFQISGTCTMDVAPDQAMIVGGVSNSGLKPEDAVGQLDQQLASMRSYIAEKHGELLLMERVRTLKNPLPGGRADMEPPFQVIQRLQVKLPAAAPVDEILQKLIELGLDRFGDNVLNNSNRREAVIRFRVSNLDAKLKDLQQQCTADGWKQFCSTPASDGICTSDKPPADIDLQNFNIRSKEPLMRPDGATAPWQLNVNRAQRLTEPPDLLGNVTVHLEGNILLTYAAKKAAKP